MISSYVLALCISAATARLTYRDTACTATEFTSSGRDCTTECGIDHAGGDYSAMPVANFQACVNACMADTNCKTAQYLTTNGYCYLKSAIGGASNNVNVNGVVCPDAVITTTTTSASTTSATPAASCHAGPVTINGRLGQVECDTDRAGGDYTNTYAATFQDCENACASDTNCQTAQYVTSSKMCYLKSAANAPIQNTGIWGIVFGAAVSSSSTTAITTTTSSSTDTTTAPVTTSSASSTQSTVTTSTTTANQYACTAGYITLNNRKAVVQCDVDYPGGSYKSQYTGSLEPCENLCTADPQCAVATYDFEQGYCYLKSQASPSPTRFRAHAIKILPTSTAAPPAKCTTAAPDSPYLLNGGFERGKLDLSDGTNNDAKLPARRGTFTTAFNTGAFEGCQAYWGYPSYPYVNNPEYSFGMYYDGLQPNTQYVLTFILGGYPDSYPGSNLHMYYRIYNDNGSGTKQLAAGLICTNNTPICQIQSINNGSGKGRFYSVPFTQGPNGGSAMYFVIGWDGTDPAPFLMDDVRINLPGDAPTAPAVQTS